MPSPDRKQVVLDQDSLALAEEIGRRIGAAEGKRLSPALRHALRLAAEKMGIPLPGEKKNGGKKKAA